MKKNITGKIVVVTGEIRSGKTMHLVALAHNMYRNGIPLYTNTLLKFEPFLEKETRWRSWLINHRLIKGYEAIPYGNIKGWKNKKDLFFHAGTDMSNCAVLASEFSTLWSGGDDMPVEIRSKVQQGGKDGIIWLIDSQTINDVHKKVRENCKEWYWANKKERKWFGKLRHDIRFPFWVRCLFDFLYHIFHKETIEIYENPYQLENKDFKAALRNKNVNENIVKEIVETNEDGEEVRKKQEVRNDKGWTPKPIIKYNPKKIGALYSTEYRILPDDVIEPDEITDADRRSLADEIKQRNDTFSNAFKLNVPESEKKYYKGQNIDPEGQKKGQKTASSGKNKVLEYLNNN